MSVRHKFITLNNVPVSLTRVEKYIQLNNIEPVCMLVSDLLQTNVLQHWCRFCVLNGRIPLYDTLSISDLYKELKNIDKVDLSKPILMMDDSVVDGIHRILKAKLNGHKTIEAYVLCPDDFLNILKRKYKK